MGKKPHRTSQWAGDEQQTHEKVLIFVSGNCRFKPQCDTTTYAIERLTGERRYQGVGENMKLPELEYAASRSVNCISLFGK